MLIGAISKPRERMERNCKTLGQRETKRYVKPSMPMEVGICGGLLSGLEATISTFLKMTAMRVAMHR